MHFLVNSSNEKDAITQSNGGDAVAVVADDESLVDVELEFENVTNDAVAWPRGKFLDLHPHQARIEVLTVTVLACVEVLHRGSHPSILGCSDN